MNESVKQGEWFTTRPATNRRKNDAIVAQERENKIRPSAIGSIGSVASEYVISPTSDHVVSTRLVHIDCWVLGKWESRIIQRLQQVGSNTCALPSSIMINISMIIISAIIPFWRAKNHNMAFNSSPGIVWINQIWDSSKFLWPYTYAWQ